MTPKEYLDRYTYLRLTEPDTSRILTVNITGYGSGWGAEPHCNRTDVGPACQTEYNQRFVTALRFAYHGSNQPIGSVKFFFNKNPVKGLEASEDFYVSSFIRSFVGKGSPDEIRDTLRVASAIGRIGMGPGPAGLYRESVSLQDYADKFITLDCNGLVGNYYGINPENSVESYANSGRRRKRAADVRVGDAVVTITESGGFQHVALIEEWRCQNMTTETGNVKMRLVEWGESGDESKHYSVGNSRDIAAKFGPNKSYGIGFAGSGNAFRYIFAPPQTPDPRGW
jgi:hypothetical protein